MLTNQKQAIKNGDFKIMTELIKTFKEHYPQIITHRTDTDFYKYTMEYVNWCKCQNMRTKWKFKVRTPHAKTAWMVDEVNYQLDLTAKLMHTEEELNFLANLKLGPKTQKELFPAPFISFLRDNKLHREDIKCWANLETDELCIEAEGFELNVQWWEIYVLEIVQELWMNFAPRDYVWAEKEIMETIRVYNELWEKKTFTLADFGCRRRDSKQWMSHVLELLIKHCKAFVGTSNVYFAMKFGIKVIGTYAHQEEAITQGLTRVPLAMSQETVWEWWIDVFRGNLGIALSDNFGFKAFLRKFDLKYMKLFDGLRHDSGNPFVWGDMLIDAYKDNGIDPLTKTGVWSDGLKRNDVVDIVNYFFGRIKVSIGQGGELMSRTIPPTSEVQPLRMVMKVIGATDDPYGEYRPAVKLSDEPGKNMCEDADYVAYVKKVYQYDPLTKEHYEHEI